MNKHTPTPWKVHSARIVASKKRDKNDVYTIAQVMCFCSGEFNGVEQKANAAFIVKAVNRHDDLVGALDEALEYFTGPVSVAGRLHAALAKAKEE